MATFAYTITSLSAIVTGVGQCAYDALDESPAGRPDRFCTLVPGEIAWDECECGQLALSIQQTYPSDTFPAPASDTRKTACGPRFVVAPVVASLTRCVPIPDDRGRAPACAELLTAGLTLEADRFLLRRAVTCCLQTYKDQYRIAEFAIGVAASVGPQGRCVGVELTFLVGLAGVCC